MIKDRLIDRGFKTMNLVHRGILKASGGRLMANPVGLPAVELHTIGRKSGLPRSCHLMSPIHDAQRVVLVASKVGHDSHPDWYRNLQAHPDAELVIHGQRRKMHARTATAEEKAHLWPQIVAAYKGYASYQRRTSRDIPVVICELRS